MLRDTSECEHLVPPVRAAKNLTTMLVAASDENTYDEALATWQSFDATTQAAIGQVNTHGCKHTGGTRIHRRFKARAPSVQRLRRDAS